MLQNPKALYQIQISIFCTSKCLGLKLGSFWLKLSSQCVLNHLLLLPLMLLIFTKIGTDDPQNMSHKNNHIYV